MPLKIVRNDITKMNTEAVVNTANNYPTVGTGCDSAVYNAAGYDSLLKYREEKIGFVSEGEVFITPGFALSKYIIHAVSPHYVDGKHGEEEKLRSCYRKALILAKENEVKSISFPLISTGGFGYPKEEGIRIAVDEINAFLLKEDMLIYLVVFDNKATELGHKIYSDLVTYIDDNYITEKKSEEYGRDFASRGAIRGSFGWDKTFHEESPEPDVEEMERKLAERMNHLSDTFSQYLMYLIQSKGMTNAEVWKRAIVDKKIFSKIKNNVDYHPQKLTALCLCVGAKLNMDETIDLLARAGYALSPCDKTDIIFKYFIENEIYDMVELDIQLEECGLPCIIS